MTTPPTLLTGSPRSGTTLLTRLLAGVDDIATFSQPLPLVLVDLKAEFLRGRGADDPLVRYPLADQQFEHAYPAADLVDFLGARQIGGDDVRAWMTRMTDYSGQYHRPDRLDELLAGWRGGDLVDLVAAYASAHGAGPRAVVWKETFAEEFAPFVLARGGRVLLLLRDVRDMVVSHVGGGAEIHAGRPRPLLFLVRQWRRTVAHALALADRPEVLVMRFEDLLAEPGPHLARVVDWLAPGAVVPDDLLAGWEGNSSFGAHRGLSRAPVGRHVAHLDDQDRRFIEALCHAEMLATGYPPTIGGAEVADALDAGPVTEHLEREELAHYRYDERRREEERSRHDALLARRWDPAMFVDRAAFDALVEVVG